MDTGSGSSGADQITQSGVRGYVARQVQEAALANGAPKPVAKCAGERAALSRSEDELQQLVAGSTDQKQRAVYVATRECAASYRPLNEGSYYPPTPSTAGEMTPAWAAFANQIDTICAVNFNRAQNAQALLDDTARREHWSEDRAEAMIHYVWAQGQAATSRMVRNLGKPPARPLLLEQWRANVAQRGHLFTKAGDAWANGDEALAGRIHAQILRLKAQSDQLGQRFGLRICTSN